jgi:transcriptional regulatory protein LevR
MPMIMVYQVYISHSRAHFTCKILISFFIKEKFKNHVSIFLNSQQLIASVNKIAKTLQYYLKK